MFAKKIKCTLEKCTKSWFVVSLMLLLPLSGYTATVDHTYDSLNRLTKTVYTKNGQTVVTEYVYDNASNMTQYTVTKDETSTSTTTTTPPVLITLSDFAATGENKQIILRWTTESEIDNAGFNLYRSETEGGRYVKINKSLIAAKGSAIQGASYEFVDDDVRNRTAYYYKLEDIDTNGKATSHGPVSATPRVIHGIK